MKLKKNDMVLVTAGKDKGKKGKVLKTFPTSQQVIVEGVNYSSKAVRPNQQNPQGGFAKIESRIHVSNVQLICPKTGKPTRIGYQVLANGEKERISKKSQEII
ncbi:MAG: 50S ribosomal protein L24 [Candidatus Omnitrophica bacterium CG11_big_fil_rev_8_21_14_0_20_45_26]|uniref:Large ribosomal subunit protein uL24 n=1 Tax=Candidatus Abzuiibacterium crystallinum TaxID=1974748 RepID=A0A2H0LNE0_9BACT|nr:MAG: 50S ribosomal protein L24 [Candidatus Omnitrophica bacterium CG11_big_fil_rev_8_21_14_0_20_45_26]PIW65098.1 MAG: 50S ribosomal protein L24 [Candidatus Omnitrophica bacterium CG12_big_fil_rev_8_21_14_0_65_45_16]